MTRKQILIKSIVTGLSLLTSVFTALYIIKWDIHNALYSVIWDYQLIKVYALISAGLFASLNLFRQIENLLTRATKSTSNSNLGGIYSYILGTIIYAIFIQFVSDYSIRVFGLTIPITLTTIGFNLDIVKDTKELAKKKVLIFGNIIILIFWSTTTVYMYMDLEYKKRAFDETKKDFVRLDSRYFKHGDSLKNVFDVHGVNFALLKKLDNDTLESLVVEQMKLYSEFSQYRQLSESVTVLQLDYILNYEEMRIMLVIGLIAVMLLNGIYLTYLIMDLKATTANNVHEP